MAVWGVLLGRAAGAVASGVAGVAVVEGVRKLGSGRSVHDAAVAVTALGLRGVRAAEAGAERVRLGTADVVAEARERNGEQAPAPDAAASHDHEH
jgi:hypothetical protein